uniref:Fe2OG dioxygenase domain-containing protein n=1 Tax=Hemiselmis andersenii TaxID=464988 RepID=A0A6U2FD33_HEMAN|mmetsp:Transcript_31295/g.73212  ORF Transcript_31295/g.73212 Transcript_31295/m.73212 type:complete len:238 (+) Transcript_31295:116-829(+)
MSGPPSHGLLTARELVSVGKDKILSAFDASERGKVHLLNDPANEDAGLHSWVVHVPGYWELSDEEFEEIWAAHPPRLGKYKGWDTPRWEQSYSVDSATVKWLEPMEKVRQCGELQERANRALYTDAFNDAHLNWYDGAQGHHIEPHQDAWPDQVPGAPIISVSWGQTRNFRLTLDRKSKCVGPVKELTLALQHGDLLVMGGACQKTHKHEVLKLKKSEVLEEVKANRRVNMTLWVFE